MTQKLNVGHCGSVCRRQQFAVEGIRLSA